MSIEISKPIMIVIEAKRQILKNPRYSLHKFGYYHSKCHTRLPNVKEEKLNFAKNKKGKTLSMAVHSENALEKQVIWCVDTGCSNHMTGSKSFLTNLNKYFQSTIRFNDLSIVNAKG